MQSAVVIRTYANEKSGGGHLMRCLALAQALVERELRVIWALDVQSAQWARERHDWVGPIVTLPSHLELGSFDEATWLKDRLGDQHPLAIVLDGYAFFPSFQQQLKAAFGRLILFDDTNETELSHADVIINWAESAESLNYQKSAPNALCCVGANYRLLRQEFTQQVYCPWSERQYLLLSFGASDTANLTLPLLKVLQKSISDSQASMPIMVVTGPGYSGLGKLKSWLQQTELNVFHSHNCQAMAQAMSNAKLAVCAAGGSQFELLACHTPALLMVVADNQRMAAEQSAKLGWCESLEAKSTDVTALANKVIALWNNAELLNNRHMLAKQFSGQSSDSLLVDSILNHLASDPVSLRSGH